MKSFARKNVFRPGTILRLIPLLAASAVSLAWDLPDPSAGTAKTIAGLESVLDARPTVRQSLGVRSARAAGEKAVTLEIGASVTDAAGNPESYRIISFDDPAYAYQQFVRPTSAKMSKVVEASGVEGSMQPEFFKTLVDLELPQPMKPGAKYFVVAQGAGSIMVTGAHTAAAVVPADGKSARDPALDQAVIGLRRIEPIGNGILLAEFGPGFSPAAGSAPEAYKVTVNGQPAGIKAMGRISRVDAYLPVGWPFKAIPAHEMFLQLEKPFQDGDRIQVEAAEKVTGGNRVATLDFSESKSFSPSIKINQIGYMANSPVKIAYLGRWLGDFPMKGKGGAGAVSDDAFWSALQAAKKTDPAEASATPASAQPQAAGGGAALYFPEPPAFQLRSAADGKVVFEGKATLVHRSGEMSEGLRKLDFAGENVYALDFTEFKAPGQYYLSVPGVGRSQDFSIDDAVFEQAFQVQSYGMMAQRSGFELDAPFSPWHRVASLMKGVVPTTLSRYAGESNAFKLLPKHVERAEAKAFVPPPALAALNSDPALLAHWPLNGNTDDVSGHGKTLTSLGGKPDFVEAPEIMPDGNKAFGPTKSSGENGLKVDSLDLASDVGVTFSLWVKVTPGMIKYDGPLIGQDVTDPNAPKLQIAATWGAFRGFAGARGEPVQIGRLNDGKWHHVAVVLDRTDGAPGELRAYIDGMSLSKYPAGTGVIPQLPFFLAKFSGDQPGGKFLDEVRVYARPLSSDDIALLARKWGESANAIETSGGHHDAGDYNPRSHIEVAQILMNAYEMEPAKFRDRDLGIPEAGNGIPDILDEAAWAMKLWPPLQNPDGGVRAGTESDGDPNFVQTVDMDTLGDFAYAPDAEASFTFAATFAQAARIWRSLGKSEQADKWLAMAEKAYQWADANRPAADSPGQLSARYLSPKALAAAELLHTTGNAKYNEDFMKVAVWTRRSDAEPDVYSLYDQQQAGWAYLKCPEDKTDPSLRDNIRKSIIKRADDYIALCSTLAYKSYRHPYAPIGWGTAAYPNSIDPVVWAWKLTKDPKYLEWIIRSVDNTLGTNPLGRSFIAGLGGRTVRAPLHNSRYSHFGEVVPGMHVQGPNEKGDSYAVKETAYPPIRSDFASLYTYADATFAIAMNEGTVPSMARCMALFGILRPDAKPDAPKK